MLPRNRTEREGILKREKWGPFHWGPKKVSIGAIVLREAE